MKQLFSRLIYHFLLQRLSVVYRLLSILPLLRLLTAVHRLASIHRLLTPIRWLLTPIRWLLTPIRWLLTSVCRRLTSIHWLLTSVCRQLTSVCRRLTSVCWLLTSICRQLTSVHQRLARRGPELLQRIHICRLHPLRRRYGRIDSYIINGAGRYIFIRMKHGTLRLHAVYTHDFCKRSHHLRFFQAEDGIRDKRM